MDGRSGLWALTLLFLAACQRSSTKESGGAPSPRSSILVRDRKISASLERMRQLAKSQAVPQLDLDGDGVQDWGVRIGATDPSSIPGLVAHYERDSWTSGYWEIDFDRNGDGVSDYVRTTRIQTVFNDPDPMHVQFNWRAEEWDDDYDGTIDHRKIFEIADGTAWDGSQSPVDGGRDGNNSPGRGKWSVHYQSDVPQTGSYTTEMMVLENRHLSQKILLSKIDVSSCGDLSAQAIASAFEDALDIGVSCLDRVSHLDAMMVRLVVVNSTDLTVGCRLFTGNESNVAGEADVLPEGCDAAISPCRVEILLNPSSDPNIRSELRQTIFHELLHAANLRIGPNHEAGWTDDRRDQVYGCERFCFPGAGTSPNDFNCRRCAMMPAAGGTCPPPPTKNKSDTATCYECNKSSDGTKCGHYPYATKEECLTNCTKGSLACLQPNACTPCATGTHRPGPAPRPQAE